MRIRSRLAKSLQELLFPLSRLRRHYRLHIGAWGDERHAGLMSLVPIWVVVGDFNRDHAQDLAIANEYSSDVSVSLNAGGTKVALSSSPNPSKAHQSVTFTATVTATAPGFPTPTGSVTFVSNAKTLGTAPLVAGVASLVRSNLPVGAHPIQANYSGDAQYNPNFSLRITQTVTP